MCDEHNSNVTCYVLYLAQWSRYSSVVGRAMNRYLVARRIGRQGRERSAAVSAAGGELCRRVRVHPLQGGLTSTIGDRRARTPAQVLDGLLGVSRGGAASETPVGRTLPRAEVTASGPGRLCDEQKCRFLVGSRVYTRRLSGV